jgi:general secretion pathway protein D
MKRSGWPFGHAISAIFLLAAVTAAAVEIAPTPDRAIEQIEGSVPVTPSPPEGNGQAPPAPPPGGEETAPAAQDAPPSGVAVPAPDSAPPPPPAAQEAPVPPAPPQAPVPAAAPPAAPPTPAPALVPPMPPRLAAPPPPTGAGFFVKFNNADIYEVIHTLGRTAGINYLIDPRVRGVVNVHTQGMLRKEAALDLLFSILKVNGATAIKEGDTYHIVPMSEAKTEPLIPALSVDGAPRGPANQVAMRAFPLQHISVAEMAKVIRPFLTPGGEAVEVGRANILLVIDTLANLEKTTRLVELFDSEVFRAAGMKLFRLKVVDPEEMAKNLENIFGALDFSARGGKPSGINFVPIPRLVSLLVVSASPKTMEDVEKWIAELDRTGGGTSRAVHRYRVKYGKVKDIAAVLEKLYPARTAPVAGEKKTEFRPAVSQLPGQSSWPGQNPPPPSTGQAMEAVAKAVKEAKEEKEVFNQPFDIISDEATNSLIIRASLSEYADALEILKNIDVYPQQVLLEVLVGEVNLSDDLKLGIDWKWTNSGGAYNQTATLQPAAALATNSFSYLVEKTGRLTAAFRALAENGRASVLSSPSVIATNGKKSKINVVDQIPITTSVLNSATNPPVTTTTVEYRDVGVILSFTPFINDFGLVTLEIEQEVSDVNTIASGSNPTFFKRSISTNLVASQDQSIVLGGLVKERKSLDRTGLPWFYKIPIIGWVFGSRADSVSRNELLIFITPRVIRNVEEGIQLSRDFEERVQQLKGRLVETKGMRLKKDDVPR